MKKLIYILLVILTGTFAAFGQDAPVSKEASEVKVTKPETVEREPFDPYKDPKMDLEQAIASAKIDGKRIILDVGGEWCGWCRHMDKFFAQNPALAKLRDENFIWIKVNYSEENYNDEFLSKYPSIKGYPHLFVLETDGTLLKSQETGSLEDEKSYDLQKFTDFLKKWSPSKTSESVPNTN